MASDQDRAEEISSAEARLKRIRFRCWHRGMKEMDLMLGGFADAKLRSLDASELDEMERILSANDQDLFSWMSGRVPVPAQWDQPLYRRIVAFFDHDAPAEA